MDPLTGGPSAKKWIYDSATCIATQITFAFAVCPFLILSLSDSLRVWARVYFYALLWTIAALVFFASPGKAMLQQQLEKRQGRASARLVRTISTESMSGGQPILGISKDPEGDITEAIEELKTEVSAREKQAKEKLSEKKKA
jgi:lysophospholipid acyltransferase